MRLYLRDRYHINLCAKHEDSIRLNSKINPHIKKFANPKKTNDSQILSLYIFVTIYIIEVMIHVNYVCVSDVRFD